MSAAIQSPTWSPKMWCIDDFVWEATQLQPCEKIDLLFYLYDIHLILSPHNSRSFDDFVQWGNMILSDFEEVDDYQVDVQNIFQYLSDQKAIELWNVDATPLSSYEQDYLLFYRSLSKYYELLREKVLHEKKAWSGLAFRLFQEKFDDYFRPFKNNIFYIIGFNALTKTEKQIFTDIQKNSKTHIIWDSDSYYLQPHHEAGYFLNQNFKSFGKPTTISNDFKNDKQIQIHPISKNIGQAIAVEQILQTIPHNEWNDTAIILNDESLLMPIINFLPNNISMNVSMGYSLKNTQIFEWITLWLSMHITASKNDHHFYYVELFKVLQHPLFQQFIRLFYADDLQNINNNILQYRKKSIPFLSLDDINNQIFSSASSIFPEVASIFTMWNNSISSALEGLKILVTIMQKSFEKENDSINLEFSLALQKYIHRFQEMVQQYPNIQTGDRSIYFIFKQIFSSIYIPFSGEPLGGLPIMGLLESRLLDFKNIIMVSVNEGMIPKTALPKTFIPFDIRKIFGIPTLSEQNAVTAYTFYRSIQRAERIFLLYNCAESTGVGSNEKSRYITQLEMELPAYNSAVKIMHHNEPLDNMQITPFASPVINKDDNIMQRLDAIANGGFSPTALNSYLECSLKYYYQNVLQIKDQDELKETIDSALLGTIVHQTIEKMHQSFVKKSFNNQDIDNMLKEVDQTLGNVFNNNWEGGNYLNGRNRLFFEVAKQWIINFLNKEKDWIKNGYIILVQEYSMKRSIKIDINGVEKVICFKGTADRICSDNQSQILIDFKTGNVKKNDVKINDIDEYISGRFREKPQSIALQLLIYAWLFSNDSLKSDLSLNAKIISLQKLNDDFSLTFNSNNTEITETTLQKVEELLQTIVQEIFNRDIPFEAAKNDKACTYCSFVELCRWKKIKTSPIDED
ncbi:MAG: PD-(D/E)XK nuclease family protein [Bacteroidales bacterium]|nr:PD-(D/E)XK nuclease family protein [Bacteroidales bacterium]